MCRPPRAFHHTTASAYELAVFPNLARGLTVTAPHRLWVANLTYINLIRRRLSGSDPRPDGGLGSGSLG